VKDRLNKECKKELEAEDKSASIEEESAEEIDLDMFSNHDLIKKAEDYI